MEVKEHSNGLAKVIFKETLTKEGKAYGENFMCFELDKGGALRVTLTKGHVRRIILGPSVERYFGSMEEMIGWCIRMQSRVFPAESIGWLTSEGRDPRESRRELLPAVRL